MANKSITVDGVEYVPVGSVEPKNSNIKIIVLQRGWVVIGRWSKKDEQTEQLDNAYVIRVWGTTKGLGELALEGKTSSTKLDKVGHVEYNVLTAIMGISAEEKVWDKELV